MLVLQKWILYKTQICSEATKILFDLHIMYRLQSRLGISSNLKTTSCNEL